MEKQDRLNLKGIMSEGYGVIPKKVMKDKDLTIEAKAIYAFMASFSGNGNTSYPSVEYITDFLDISRHRFNRHRKLLEEKGYISVSQERKKGSKFNHNVYTLEFIPKVQFTTSENPTAEKRTSENDTTNNNTFNNNTINNNTKSTSRSKLKFETHHMELSKLLLREIQQHIPSYKAKNMERWANDFRLMMEVDKREGKEIQDLIIFAQRHNFWYKNILSPGKLREKYHRLLMDMNEEKGIKSKSKSWAGSDF